MVSDKGGSVKSGKYPEKCRIQAEEMLKNGMTPAEVARALHDEYPMLTEQVVYYWRRKLRDQSPEVLSEARQARKEEFALKAWDTIMTAHAVMDKRLKRALDHEEQLDKIVEEVEDLDDNDLSQDERRELKRKMATIRVDDIAKLSTALGTLYDKQALASKDATEIVGGSLTVKKFEDY